MRAASVTAELERWTSPGARAQGPTLDEAQAYCRRLAATHYENFTVASWLLPRRLRQPFANVYAYCRWADDLADETAGGQQALDLLDWWEGELLACYGGQPTHPVLVALAETIREYEIPREPFRQLLVAFRQDQHVTRYETEAELFDYCRSSANPVGRLVLYLGRCCDAENAALADHICTALQIANFCQDVRRDWERGRIYLPRETRERCGCREQQLADGVFDDAWRAVVAYHAAGAEVLFAAGEPLVARLPRELQLDVWLFIAGGRAILRKIREANYDVWSRRPVVGKRAQLGLLARGGWLKLCGRLGRVRGAVPGAGA